ncbi:E3 ubiquitin-protein ligase complex slx8-rfp subunit slx8 isoform X2 [Drosophila yakuba]|uniref:Uncharacterized protein, isoform C n=1 Tax=Drosophila yakuba TaxID=7245 RepID=A0A0R1EA24_DROYA|nr:E3 ubiquitin-protein ligase complex slx8-rfp subunit slx8 isoform X2 [Drosophila yakuba]KRK03975.1 uncharacterized protein Dyak_GE10170, isoform C [Drosophila yakuba]
MSDSTIFPFNLTTQLSIIAQSAESNVSSSSSNSSVSESSAESHLSQSADSNVSSSSSNSSVSESIASNSYFGSNTSVESHLSVNSNSSLDNQSPEESYLSVESDSSPTPNTSESFSAGEASNQLQSPQSNSSLNMSHDESHSVANWSLSNDDAHSQIRSLTQDVAQMEAELDSINRYCEEVVAQIDTLPTSTSTPTVVRGNRRRSAMNPVEIIDLSHLEFVPPVRSARNRAPDAVIDLCTPDGPRSRPVNLPSNDSFTIPSRRRVLAQSTENSPVVDLDDVSPPKRVYRDIDLSHKEDSYKCPVCMDSVTKREPVSTKCGHVFCRECIQTAISATHKCPMCNKKLTARQFFRIYFGLFSATISFVIEVTHHYMECSELLKHRHNRQII